MATRAENLALINALDDTDVEELARLTEMIFTPDEDQLVTVTYVQMVQKAHELADIYFPQWTDRSQSDFGQFLVELFAYFSEKDFWYINALANEGFLQKAKVYSNVYLKAFSNGYEPAIYKPAVAHFRLTIAAGDAVVAEIGEIEIASESSAYVYTNVERVSIAVSGVPVTKDVLFAEGTIQTSSATYAGKAIRIRTNKVAPEYTTQTVAGTSWTRKVSLAQSKANSKHFIIIPDAAGAATIYYGDDTYGLKPTLGDEIVSTFRVCNGTDGNNLTLLDDWSISSSPTGRTVTAATQLELLAGGVTQESIESIRNNASMYFRTQKSIKNPSDCMLALNRRSEVHKSYAYYYAGGMYFYIIRNDGVEPTAEYLFDIKNEISEITTMGVVPYGVVNTYITVETEVTVYVLTDYNTAATESAIQTEFYNYTDPLVDGAYGKNFDLDDMATLLQGNVFGVQNVVFNTINSGAPADVAVDHNQIMEKMTSGDITLTMISI